MFRGAGWNVIKVIWGHTGSAAGARQRGLLRKLMMETVDGEYQACKAFGGAYTREHFFGKYPELREMVTNLRRGHLAPQPRRPRSAQRSSPPTPRP